MTMEEKYLNHKKKGLLEHVRKFNERNHDVWQFPINENNFDIEHTFCSPDVCRDCGRCCSNFPCVFAPSDFLDITDLDYMRRLLDTEVICISEVNWDGTLVIRPRGLGDLGVVSLGSQIKLHNRANPCMLNSRKGCLLPDMYRPSEGLLYHAIEEYEHVIMYTEKNIADEYRAYNDILFTLLSEYAYKKSSPYVAEDKENIQKLTRYMAGYKR